MNTRSDVGFLHPGLMGQTLAAACGSPAVWASTGRSSDTKARAEASGLIEVKTVRELVDRVGIIVSICPPAAAESVAAEVASHGFGGVYVDANAIGPDTSRRIAGSFRNYVDGSVIGPPANRSGTTRLYLSGEGSHEVAALWEGSVLDARVIDGGVGAASALKMAFASWTKIGSAMLLAVCALAEANGVGGALLNEWEISQPHFVERRDAAARGVAPKAWRFIGEMEQISATFAASGLPAGFADAAGEIYERIADLRGQSEVDLEDVLRLLSG